MEWLEEKKLKANVFELRSWIMSKPLGYLMYRLGASQMTPFLRTGNNRVKHVLVDPASRVGACQVFVNGDISCGI